MAQQNFKVVIPARFGSSRLPGKPLLDIVGKPMVQHVYERALESGVDPDGGIVIATDDQRIIDIAAGFGAHAIMTSKDHQSGTDRLAEVAKILGWDDQVIVVNLQGDEPLMPPDLIASVAANLGKNAEAGISTFSTPITNTNDLCDPNIVKVVTNQKDMAMYFSRAPIPWNRDKYTHLTASSSSCSTSLEGFLPERHLGMYAYRVETLKTISNAPVAEIEVMESLEQLRALWMGVAIHVQSIAQPPGHGVDTQDDLERVRKELAASS